MHTNIHTRAHKHTCMSALLLHKHSYDSSKHSEHHAFMLFMESLPAAACLKDVPCEVGLGQGKGRPTGADPYSFGCRRWSSHPQTPSAGPGRHRDHVPELSCRSRCPALTTQMQAVTIELTVLPRCSGILSRCASNCTRSSTVLILVTSCSILVDAISAALLRFKIEFRLV
jgi:hypothetical protein